MHSTCMQHCSIHVCDFFSFAKLYDYELWISSAALSSASNMCFPLWLIFNCCILLVIRMHFFYSIAKAINIVYVIVILNIHFLNCTQVGLEISIVLLENRECLVKEIKQKKMHERALNQLLEVGELFLNSISYELCEG